MTRGSFDEGRVIDTLPATDRDNAVRTFSRAEALQVATVILERLRPHCEKIAVVGSIRRRKERVKDIELLFVPKMCSVPDQSDMFGHEMSVDAAAQAIDQLLAEGVIAKRPNSIGSFAWGEKNKLALHVESGIPVDFFSTTSACWFNAVVVRTGPAESNIAIASAAQKLGWSWHAYGDGFTRGEGTHPIDRFTPKSGREVFEFVNLPYREPWERG